MIKSYFKIAWRNLFRNKGFSLTNLLSLTIGITCTALILLWVQDEMTYDQFHANYKNVYQVIANRDFNNRVFTDRNMVLPLARSLENVSPQIKNAVVTTYNQTHLLTIGETKLKKNGYTVSEHFFDVFTWKFLKGDAAKALAGPSSIVLTQSAAKSLFGNADPIGKALIMDRDHNVKVSAIVADPPGNSSFSFDYIVPFNYADADTKRSMNEWVNSSWNVFVLTVPGANMAQVNKTINDIKKQHDHNDAISTYFTFPMSRWHLYSDFKDGKNAGGMIEYVKLFSAIALIILLIACVNFMNLSTARSEKRAREVGIRKTLGSGKRQLIMQFFFESMILALISFIFSMIAVYFILPSFNTLLAKKISLDLSDLRFWAGSLAIIIFTGIVAGSYPALYLSSFNPVKILKGTFLPGKQAVLPRRILVVTQFVISILLISSTIIVYQQIQYIKNRSVGYDPNNLIMFPSSDEIDKSFAVVKQELLKSGMIDAVTRTSSPITEVWWKTGSPDWEGKPANLSIIMSGIATDVDFTKTMGIRVLQGKDFSGTPADSSSMLLNRAAVEAMGLKNPVGMQMRYGRNYTVIGVADNIIMESPFKPVDPMLILYNGENSSRISVRLKDNVQPQKALALIGSIYKRFNPADAFDYQFVDQEYGKKFTAEQTINKITNIFAALAIFICCIGLAGLASFTIEKRIREIGIRKVLGATVGQLLMLISREFLKLVMIAFVIAVPLTWWFMYNWLQKYDFRVTISSWLFISVGGVILLLTMAVVSLNTIRAAMSNPVKALRTE